MKSHFVGFFVGVCMVSSGNAAYFLLSNSGLPICLEDSSTSVCYRCAGAATIDSCYIKGETTYYDASGAFKFSYDCYYK